MRTKQRARLEDVARVAGVAPITVSRGLRDPGKVSAETLERIRSAIATVNYVPNLVAGSLASQRTRMIGAVIPTITDSIYASTVDGLTSVLREQGFQVLLGISRYELAEEEAMVAQFLGRRADGLFLSGVRHTEGTRRLIADAGVPVVETGNLTAQPIDMVVGFSNRRAAEDMVRHLAGRGYRKIGFIGAETKDNPQAEDRQAGWRAAVRELGLPGERSLVLEAPRSIPAGGAALTELRRRHPDMDAVFAAGEVWAVGAILEAQRRGWRVPREIAIAGFNDESIAAHLVPALTTVRVPRLQIGRRAAELLLARLGGGPVDTTLVDLGYEIVVRAST